MSMGMMRHGIVKSVGPDVDKILSTLAYLGPTYRFLISGYPPFLKHLIDEGERRGFPWADYELHGLVGGEGMTEELRDVLLARFASVFSGYGATDIEIGMAGESPVSIAVRRLARARPDIGRALFGRGLAPADGLPVQPAHPLHGGQRARRGDLHGVAAGPPGAAHPLQRPRRRRDRRVRDGRAGSCGRSASTWIGSASRPEVHGPRGPLPWARPIPLPFLWIHGRRDATISVMGSNIYPEDIESVALPRPARRAAAPLVHALGRRRRDRHAAAGGRDRAGEPRGRRRRVAHGGRPSGSGTGWAR